MTTPKHTPTKLQCFWAGCKVMSPLFAIMMFMIVLVAIGIKFGSEIAMGFALSAYVAFFIYAVYRIGKEHIKWDNK